MRNGRRVSCTWLFMCSSCLLTILSMISVSFILAIWVTDRRRWSVWGHQCSFVSIIALLPAPFLWSLCYHGPFPLWRYAGNYYRQHFFTTLDVWCGWSGSFLILLPLRRMWSAYRHSGFCCRIFSLCFFLACTFLHFSTFTFYSISLHSAVCVVVSNNKSD